MGAGIEQLVRFDSRFKNFAGTMFYIGQRDSCKDRDQYTQQEAEALDASIAEFLTLLSPLFLRPAALNTLEHLVRKYRCPWMLACQGMHHQALSCTC